jgi:hypothetical protein
MIRWEENLKNNWGSKMFVTFIKTHIADDHQTRKITRKDRFTQRS